MLLNLKSENSHPNDWDAIVIGSGFAGLAVSIRLACKGYSVLILEKNDFIGGRARSFKLNDYQFDAGPTVLTGTHLFEELFQISDEKMSDYLQLIPINPFYRIFDEQNHKFDFHQDPVKIKNEISKISIKDGQKTEAYLKRVKKLYKTFYPYTERNMSNFRVMLTMLPFLIFNFGNLSIRTLVNKYFKNDFIRQAMEFHPLLVGGNPKNTPSLYALIEEFERQTGVYYSLGGTARVIKSLAQLFTKHNGQIQLNTDIKRINYSNGHTTGVTLADGTTINSKIVISNADPNHTYNVLLPNQKSKIINSIKKLRWKIQIPSMSLYVFYFGMDKKWVNTDLLHHSIIYTGKPGAAINQIFSKTADSSTQNSSNFMYVHMPTLTDATIAPENCDSIYVLVAARAILDHTEIENKEIIKSNILKTLDKYLPDLESHIVCEESIDPAYFRDVLNSPFGSAFSAQPTLFQSAWFRPHNKSKSHKGLYFVGAGTHPGAGVPAVLSSAKITEQLALSYLTKFNKKFAKV